MITFTPKKNIVLFSLEAKSRHLFETFGGPYPSPNLSRLVAQGVDFTQMHSAAGSTAMSLASVVHGRYTHDLGRVDYDSSTVYGDNIFSEMTRRGRRSYFVWHDSQEFLIKYIPKIYKGPDVEVRGASIDDPYFSTAVARKVIEIANESDQPFFIMAHTSPERPCDPSLKSEWRNEHERFIFEDDLAIGILLDNLDLQDTRIILYSDHGVHTGQHGGMFEYAFSLYQPILNVPCVVSDDRPGRATDPYSLINLYDIALDRSVAPPAHIISDTMYPSQVHRVTAVRRGDWKYMAHYNWGTAITGLQEELYDLRVDPGENRNLLNDVARCPLRVEWNAANLQQPKHRKFGYNDDLIRTNVRELRSIISDIWVSGFLPLLSSLDPAIKADLEQKLEFAHPVEKMSIIGTLVEMLCEKPPCYENVRPGTVFPGLPVAHPGLPRIPKNVHFSTYDAPPVDSLFMRRSHTRAVPAQTAQPIHRRVEVSSEAAPRLEIKSEVVSAEAKPSGTPDSLVTGREAIDEKLGLRFKR